MRRSSELQEVPKHLRYLVLVRGFTSELYVSRNFQNVQSPRAFPDYDMFPHDILARKDELAEVPNKSVRDSMSTNVRFGDS